MENKCPKCGSTNTYVDKKGFSGKQAVAGAIMAGSLGAAAGTINSNKIKITCLKCGYSYYAGEYEKELSKFNRPKQEFTAGGLALFMFFFSLFTCIIWAVFDSRYFGILSIITGVLFVISLMVNVANKQRQSSKKGPRQKRI